MRDEAIVVRPLNTDEEVAAYFALAASTFSGYHQAHATPTPAGSLALGWRRFVEDAPDFDPVNLRGAFVDGKLVGGYQHDERWLNVDGVQLRSGYVGGVVTAPTHRGRGVATVLMRDGISLASKRQQALLVLRGIPDFYHRFGYVDVMDVTEHVVERSLVLAMPKPDCVVRRVTLDDAPALLTLYERHYGSYTGSYARTLAQQEHLVRHRTNPALMAFDAGGNPRGYLLLPAARDQSGAVEVAADTWPAALALLQHHATLAEESVELRWPLPQNSRTYLYLADHLSLRSEMHSRPNAGWMARPGHLGALFEGLVPLWRGRWRRVRTDWSGVLGIEVVIPEGGGERATNERCFLELTSKDLRRVDESPGASVIRLNSAIFSQLVFGYRPAHWALVPQSLLPPLDALFPSGVAWYPASNRC